MQTPPLAQPGWQETAIIENQCHFCCCACAKALLNEKKTALLWYLHSSQKAPVTPKGHSHLKGATQLPPFWQPGWQNAAKKRTKRELFSFVERAPLDKILRTLSLLHLPYYSCAFHACLHESSSRKKSLIGLGHA